MSVKRRIAGVDYSATPAPGVLPCTLAELELGKNFDHKSPTDNWSDGRVSATFALTESYPGDGGVCVGIPAANLMARPPFEGGTGTNWTLIFDTAASPLVDSMVAAVAGLAADLKEGGKGKSKCFVGREFEKLPIVPREGGGWRISVSVPGSGLFVKVLTESGTLCPDDRLESDGTKYSRPLPMERVRALIGGSADMRVKFGVDVMTWNFQGRCGVTLKAQQALLFGPPLEEFTGGVSSEQFKTVFENIAELPRDTLEFGAMRLWRPHEQDHGIATDGEEDIEMARINGMSSDPEKYAMAEPVRRIYIVHLEGNVQLSNYSEERKRSGEGQLPRTIGNIETVNLALAYGSSKESEHEKPPNDPDGSPGITAEASALVKLYKEGIEGSLMGSFCSQKVAVMAVTDVEHRDKITKQTVLKTVTQAAVEAIKDQSFREQDEDSNPNGRMISFIKDTVRPDATDPSVVHRNITAKCIRKSNTSISVRLADGTLTSDPDFPLEDVRWSIESMVSEPAVYACAPPEGSFNKQKGQVKFCGVKCNVRHLVLVERPAGGGGGGGGPTEMEKMTATGYITTAGGKRLRQASPEPDDEGDDQPQGAGGGGGGGAFGGGAADGGAGDHEANAFTDFGGPKTTA